MTASKFLPKGSATWPIDYDGPPKEYVFVLLQKLTMLALASAIEPLRVANQIARKELYHWRTMSEDGAQVTCSNGQTLFPDSVLQPVARATTAIVVSGVEPHRTLSPIVTQWARRQRRLGSKMGSVCSGAFTLADAGLLTGKTFTLHWENQVSFTEVFEQLTPTHNLFEVDGDLLTAAGGAAATDLMLWIIESDFGGNFAIQVADMCLHSRSNARGRAQRSSQSAILKCRNQSMIKAVQLMEANLEDPLTLEDIAEQVKTSRRQLERNFKTYLEVSPSVFYTGLRVSLAYALLGETDMSVTEVAAASGFTSASNLSKHFRDKYAVSPSQFNKSWTGSPKGRA